MADDARLRTELEEAVTTLDLVWNHWNNLEHDSHQIAARVRAILGKKPISDKFTVSEIIHMETENKKLFGEINKLRTLIKRDITKEMAVVLEAQKTRVAELERELEALRGEEGR